MSMLDDDLAMMHADGIALGMCTASGTYIAADSLPVGVTMTLQEVPQPYLIAEAAETRRREATADVRRSVIAAPAKGDTVILTTEPYAGTWTVADVGAGDEGCWLLTLRLDERTTMGTGRRQP